MIVWGAWVMMAALLFGNRGFRLFLSRRFEVRHERQVLASLQKENISLALEWNQIQNDPAYTEYLIRKNLGYIKKDEVEYRCNPSALSQSNL